MRKYKQYKRIFILIYTAVGLLDKSNPTTVCGWVCEAWLFNPRTDIFPREFFAI